jgi:hypothetical protein
MEKLLFLVFCDALIRARQPIVRRIGHRDNRRNPFKALIKSLHERVKKVLTAGVKNQRIAVRAAKC